MRDIEDDPKVPEGTDDDLQLLRSAAVAAGILACAFFRKPVKVWNKANASPVSEADVTVNRFLEQTLRSTRPAYGWLSEESSDDPARLTTDRVFVVDPIDGTRGFIDGRDSWTICIAVVEHGRPIAGVIYAPARDEMYEASLGGGARLNGRPLARRRLDHDERPLIPTPGAVHQQLQAAGLDYRRGPFAPSLAYRLMQVATGALDAAVARRGANDWDIAAAALILAEAGIAFADVCEPTLRFNTPHATHGALAAIADESLKVVLHRALRHVYGCPGEAVATGELEHRHS
jgi:myo-inositol-1(or 4)-monophosphatase